MLAGPSSGVSYSRIASKGVRSKAKDDVVDDWEAEVDEGDDESKPAAPRPLRAAADVAGDPWEAVNEGFPTLSIGASNPGSGREDPRKVWEEANRSGPSSTPIIFRAGGSSSSSRPATLPSSILPPSLSSSATSATPSVVLAAPPPRILSRPKDSSAELDARATQAALAAAREAQRKTLQEREEEYRRARARIFGGTDKEDKELGSGASSEAQGEGAEGRGPTPGGGSGGTRGSAKPRGGGASRGNARRAARGRPSANGSGSSSPARDGRGSAASGAA